MDKTTFINQALHEARTAYAKKPTFNPIIAAAQAVLESAWGHSQLARLANNLKGVKAGRSWRGPVVELPTTEQRPDGSEYVTVARWRKYDSWAEAFEDYGALIERVYPHAMSVKHDPRAFLEALVERDYPKYATAIRYIEKVWSIVEQYGLLEAEASHERAGRRLKSHHLGKFLGALEIPPGKRTLVVIALEPDGSINLDVREG